MQTHLRGRDLIDLPGVDQGRDRHAARRRLRRSSATVRSAGRTRYLRDKVLAMLFFFSSTRTRASFEAGMAQLGGHAQFIESRTTQIAHGDTAKEIGEILGRYNDGIAIRHVDWERGNKYIREVAEASRVPVLNMQCDIYHPHQALADLMTIIERFGDPRGRTATVSWAYASSYQKPISVAAEPGAAAAAVRHERAARPPAGVRADARDRRAGARTTPGGRTPASRSCTTSTRASAAPTSSTPRAGAP